MARGKLLLVILFGSILFLAACKEDGESGDPTGTGNGGKPPPEMVGSWVYESVTVDGSAATLAAVMDWTAGAVEARLHVQASSAYVYEEVNAMGGQLWAESGFIFIDGDELDVNVQFDSDGPTNEMIRMGFTLATDTLTLRQDEAGSTLEFTLTK